ncbi:MAG TPA: hypothetical protein DCM38_11090, partial [Gammaproteobacteria bacterium]|nr:hypothetical protein [Gammaproteobacteria bacterium]
LSNKENFVQELVTFVQNLIIVWCPQNPLQSDFVDFAPSFFTLFLFISKGLKQNILNAFRGKSFARKTERAALACSPSPKFVIIRIKKSVGLIHH